MVIIWVVEVDVFDVGEWVFDFVVSLFVVDVVGYGVFVRGVENDEIYCILFNMGLFFDGEWVVVEMMNYWK